MVLWKFTDEIGCFFPEEISKRTLPNGNISSKVIVGSCIVNDAILADIDGIVLIQAPINTDNIASLNISITFLCVSSESKNTDTTSSIQSANLTHLL